MTLFKQEIAELIHNELVGLSKENNLEFHLKSEDIYQLLTIPPEFSFWPEQPCHVFPFA